MSLEYCCECSAPTGRAGRYDDSIFIGGYFDEEIGPLCEECRSNYRVCEECGKVIEHAKDGTYYAKDEVWRCSGCKAEADHQNEQYRATKGRMK